jgi:thymidylate synthase
MTMADKIFKQNLKEILEQPWEVDNRARWKDGSPIATKRIVSVVNKYDLSKEFPALTLRPTPIKTCFREIDWIYRQRSNNVNDLKAKIWDDWADENGSIGKAYGYQVSKPVFGYDNQMDYILGELKKNPTSRRLVIELWNVNELDEMNLPPCAHHVQFLQKSGKLHMILKQRSNDFLVANNFNVVQYSLLLHMVARHTGYNVGTLTHVIGDCHIYNRHMAQAKIMMEREELATPVFWLNPEKTNFYDFTEDDVKLFYAEKHEQLKFNDVAI